MPDRLTWTISEAAQILGIGRGLAYEMARDGRLPVLRLSRRLVVPKASLDALLQADPARPTDGQLGP